MTLVISDKTSHTHTHTNTLIYICLIVLLCFEACQTRGQQRVHLRMCALVNVHNDMDLLLSCECMCGFTGLFTFVWPEWKHTPQGDCLNICVPALWTDSGESLTQRQWNRCVTKHGHVFWVISAAAQRDRRENTKGWLMMMRMMMMKKLMRKICCQTSHYSVCTFPLLSDVC